MLIGLISDTHITRHIKALPGEVMEAFADVDLILHAGDIYEPSVLDELESIAPVLAARGNGDDGMPPDLRVKETHLLDLQGMKLGLTHILEFPEPDYLPLEKQLKRYFGGHVDIVVFGDTHVQEVAWHKGTLVINPGSPTLPRNLFELGTVALLSIEAGRADARIIQLVHHNGVNPCA